MKNLTPTQSASAFDPEGPLSPKTRELLPLRRWPSAEIAKQFFLRGAISALLKNGIDPPDSNEEFVQLVRRAWHSAGLLLECDPNASWTLLWTHVQQFLVNACKD